MSTKKKKSKARIPNPKIKEESPDVRPVGIRALKSTMDSLRPWLSGCRVLDLYAGQGRFGWSALDEEADSVTLVEKHAVVAEELKKEWTRRKASPQVQIVVKDALEYLEEARLQKLSFDIIFADPPFPFWKGTFESELFTAVSRVAASAAIFLVKHPSRVLISDSHPGFSFWKASRFGESTLLYVKYVESETNAR